MRIIAGQWKGKTLQSPADTSIRPTSERTREALFNVLMHLEENPLLGLPVADICCGSGALGLEALSRGASHCSFIDNATAALKLTQANITHVGAGGRAKVIQASAAQMPSALQPVSLVLIDPPYKHLALVQSCHASLRERGWLREGTIISIEHSIKDAPLELDGCELFKQRNYGKSEITLYRVTAA